MELFMFALGIFVYSLLFLGLTPKARQISLIFIIVSFFGVILTFATNSDIARAVACAFISLALVFPFAIEDGFSSDTSDEY